MAKKSILIDSSLSQYTAEDFSFLQSLFHEAGILGDNVGALGLKVSQRGAGANMSVDVAIGNALMIFTKSAVTWKIIGMSNAVDNIVIASNSSGSNRVDAIIMRASISVTPNALKNNVITIERVAGSGVSALSDGAITTAIGGDMFIRLANVTVPNAAASIVDANIGDTRVAVKTNDSILLAPKVLSFTVTATDPTTPTEGQMWFNSTTHELKCKDNTSIRSLFGLTSDATSQSTNDQVQSTQNAVLEVGEANATTKKNLLAQSFIPGKTKIRGVKLYKTADLGTFTGNVVVSLQADASGSPSGTDLASVTILNKLYLSYGVGEFTAIFSSEYASLVVGNLYWIVVTPSTSDNTNHPNLGTNSAGGYASGSVKYKNVTDGWVVVATVDLYFKTLEGNANQVIKTGNDGKMPADFYDITKMPNSAYQQMIPLPNSTSQQLFNSSSNQDGTVLILNTGLSSDLIRLEKDPLTGIFMQTHAINMTATSGGSYSSVLVLGIYVYVFTDSGNNITTYRYLLADLTGETSITMPAIDTAGSYYRPITWTDGVFIYLVQEKAGTTCNKLSVSGTVISAVTTSTTLSLGIMDCSTMFDGVNNYYLDNQSNPNMIIRKYSDIFLSASVNTTKIWETWTDSQSGAIIINIDTQRMYIGRMEQIYDQTTNIKKFLVLIPISKP